MADEYVMEMQCLCGVGGIHCDCCNRFRGKDKKKLNRIARHRLKEKMKKVVDIETDE